MDIKRSFLWVILILSITLLFDNWQRFNGHAGLLGQPAATPAQTENNKGIKALPKADSSAPPNAHSTAQNTMQASSRPSKKIAIHTDVYQAEIDPIGATLSYLALLQEKDPHEIQGHVVLFQENALRTYLARSGLIGGDFPNHNDLFHAQAPINSTNTEGKKVISVSLQATKGGLHLIKTYRFTQGSYVIEVESQLINQNAKTLQPTLYTELVRDDTEISGSKFTHTFTGPAIYTDADKFQKNSFSDIAKGKAAIPSEASTNGWVAMIQHYFAAAWLPAAAQPRAFYLDQLNSNLYRIGIKQILPPIAAGQTLSNTTRLFAGPQKEHMLEAIEPNLELVKDYGWFTMLAKPLFWLLSQLHKSLDNWGWAIIALTGILKLVFFPLSAASFKSMARMKAMAPRIQMLREQYKETPQELNRAMMELYRTEKINPFGGCLPILIQIPVFIALYWVLLSSVEMRNAPWLLWVQDLSTPDPYYILPILMAASMFLQTKLNPAPPDPLQAKMMMIMPLVFSIFFLFLPSGLVLYYVVNNILSIIQQWSINRVLTPGDLDKSSKSSSLLEKIKKNLSKK